MKNEALSGLGIFSQLESIIIMSELEEVVSEDFGFKLSTAEDGISLFSGPIDVASVENKELRLFSIANIKKWFAASDLHSVVVGPIASIAGESLGYVNRVDGFSEITHIYFNSDESVLFILDSGEIKKAKIAEMGKSVGDSLKFSTLNLSSDISNIRSISTSPAFNNILAFRTEDQNLYVQQDNSTRKIASNVSTYCWSNDGKALIYYNNSDIVVSNFESTVESSVPITFESFDDFSTEDYTAVSLTELETNKKWLVVFDLKAAAVDDHDIKHFVIRKDDNEVTTHSVDICPPYSSAQRYPSYYTAKLQNWSPNFSHEMITSSLSTDINVVTIDSSNSIFVTTQSEDTNRAQFPIDDDSGDDLSPVGIALDFSCTEETVTQPCTGVDEVMGKLPKLWSLTHTGKLIGWWIFDKKGINNGEVSLEGPMHILKTMISSKTETSDFENSTSKVIGPEELGEVSKDTAEINDKEISSTGNEEKTETSLFNSERVGSDVPSNISLGSNGLGSTGGASSGFGSSGFGKSSFGSSGFGSSGFGSSGFGKSSFGSSGFGSSGFGKSGFGSSEFGATGKSDNQSTKPGVAGGVIKSGFGNYASGNPDLRGSDNKNSSPFASLNSSVGGTSGSPFASLHNNNKTTNNSPFASLGSNSQKSPFADLSTNLNKPKEKLDETSPFASLSSNKNDSPFLGLSQEKETKPSNNASSNNSVGESPFAKLMINREQSDQSTKPKNSPFNDGTLSLDKTEKHEDANASPFAKLSSSVTVPSEDEKPKNLFSGLHSSSSSFSPFSKFSQAPSDIDAPIESKSGNIPLGSFQNSLSFNTPLENSSIHGKESDSSEDDSSSTASESNESEKSANPSQEKTQSKANNNIPNIVGTSNKQGKPLSFENLSLNVPESNSTNFKDKSGLDQSKPGLLTSGFSNAEILKDNPFSESNTGKSEEWNTGNDSQVNEDNTTSSYSASQFESTSEEASNDSDGFEEEYRHESLNQSQSDKDLSLGNVNQSESHQNSEETSKQNVADNSYKTQSKHFIDAEPLPQSIQFYVNDSSNLKVSQKKSEIERKIEELYSLTSAHLEVLSMNTSALASFLDSHSEALESIDSEALSFPEKWRLANIVDLQRMIEKDAPCFFQKLKQLRDQDSDARGLTEQLSEFQTVRVHIDKLISELQLISSSSTSSVLAKRPLDFQNEELQNNLRRKLRNVKELEKRLISIMMPLKSNLNMNDTTVRNMQKVIFQISESLNAHSKEVDTLTKAIGKISLEQPSQDKNTSETYLSFPKPRQSCNWKLSEIFSDVNVKTKIVSIE